MKTLILPFYVRQKYCALKGLLTKGIFFYQFQQHKKQNTVKIFTLKEGGNPALRYQK